MSDLPPTQVVALGYSIVGSLGDDAQITFHHAIAEDEKDDSVNAKLDRIMGFISRLKSMREAPALQKELADLQDKLLLLDGDIANAETNFQRQQAEIDVQIETAQAEIQRIHDFGYERHKRSGRGGSYVPKGGEGQQIAAIKTGIEQASAAKAKNVTERELFLSNVDTNKQRMTARVAYLTAKLAEIDKLVT